jgi:hypothetical protein
MPTGRSPSLIFPTADPAGQACALTDWQAHWIRNTSARWSPLATTRISPSKMTRSLVPLRAAPASVVNAVGQPGVLLSEVRVAAHQRLSCRTGPGQVPSVTSYGPNKMLQPAETDTRPSSNSMFTVVPATSSRPPARAATFLGPEPLDRTAAIRARRQFCSRIDRVHAVGGGGLDPGRSSAEPARRPRRPRP